jgi:hypothetical protein
MTIAELRAHVKTDLTDDALQQLLDDAEAAIEEAHGQLETQTDTFEGETGANALFLSRKALTITTVVEEVCGVSTTLETDDYVMRYENRQIKRLTTGTNPRRTWGDVVIIAYVPVDETAQRTRMAIDLVKLAVQYNALGSESVGDYKMTGLVYEDERNKILSRLRKWNFA